MVKSVAQLRKNLGERTCDDDGERPYAARRAATVRRAAVVRDAAGLRRNIVVSHATEPTAPAVAHYAAVACRTAVVRQSAGICRAPASCRRRDPLKKALHSQGKQGTSSPR